MTFLIFCLYLLTFNVYEAIGVTVTTPLGPVVGTEDVSIEGKPFLSFQGIPFAKPPVGPLRFKKPVAVDRWTDPLVADNHVSCIQADGFNDNQIMGQEDCLVLSVYSPKGEKDLPVLVWIHGGAFYMGSGNQDFYGPHRLMDHGIMVVSINYRLGVLGFSSVGDDAMPGNQGLWDQIQALKWVQQNIAAFGGDPNKVTIVGESAGSMSVMYLYLSPKAKGLFRGAIAQSGTPQSAFCHTDKHPAYYVRSVAATVGCDPEVDSSKILECMQKADGAAMIESQEMFKLHKSDKANAYPFKPIVDDFTSDPLLPKDPLDMISGKRFNDVPLIVGFTKDEGLASLIAFIIDQNHRAKHVQHWNTVFGPWQFFGREPDEISSLDTKAMEAINKKMFSGGQPTEANIEKDLPLVYSMANFEAPGILTARLLAAQAASPVFEYTYNHHGTITLLDMLTMKPWQFLLRMAGRYVGLDLFTKRNGACHGDELFIMFKTVALPLDGVYTDEDKWVSQKLLTMWTDFVKTGNPTPQKGDVEWKRTDPKNPQRLQIDSDRVRFGPCTDMEDRYAFWQTTVWQQMPPRLHLKSSPTWKNPKMYQKVAKAGQEEPKSEL